MKPNEDTQAGRKAPTSPDPTSEASSGRLADSTPTGNKPEGVSEAQLPSQDEARVPSPGDTPSETRDVGHPLQAAQLEHNPSTDGVSNPGGSNDCALAGGDSPQSPTPFSKPKPAKKSRQKKRDNHVSVRLTDEELDVLDRYMRATGKTQSEAVRDIIRASENKGGEIHLKPKAPPVQLEKLLGELSKWRKEFSKAKPRLNIPTPASDNERYDQVTVWRLEADRLLKAIPKLEEVLNAALGAVTRLTPEKVEALRGGIPILHKLHESAVLKGNETHAKIFMALHGLIVDTGIKTKS